MAWLLKESLALGGGSEKSRFDLPDVQTDVISPSVTYVVTDFSVDQRLPRRTRTLHVLPVAAV